MPRGFERSVAAKNAATDAECALLDGGVLALYDADGTLLAELSYGSPAFRPARDGASALATAVEGKALIDGEAVAFLATRADRTPVWRGTVGTRDTDLVLPRTAFKEEESITIDSWVYQAR